MGTGQWGGFGLVRFETRLNDWLVCSGERPDPDLPGPEPAHQGLRRGAQSQAGHPGNFVCFCEHYVNL